MTHTRLFYSLFVSYLVILPGIANAAAFHSSIQIPYTKVAESKEEANTPSLKKLARLSYADAIAVARKRYHGKLGRVDLENEDGNLIYSVEIGKRELAIDAGNGKILLVE